MEALKNPPGRKKILIWLAAALGSITILRFLPSGKKTEPDEEMVTMLTQDGKLVSVSKKMLTTRSEKLTNKEMQNWIKK